MSQSHLDSSAYGASDSSIVPNGRSPQSFLESFFSSFFQEKNIKWMLIVGAAIVFGSSLMLVTKAWPEWTPTLRYLTILGYTATIFGAAQVSLLRLNLNATSRVLNALTLMLLPICFLSLTWLSSGTAVQNSLHAAWNGGWLVPAIGLLWIASSRILDHWLRGRQTTFLVSFCLLCVAGALPSMTSPVGAFAFIAIAWIVLTAGVMKVNRHTFWLTEEHRLPRVFGFLPIAILGIQFVVLVAVKAAASLPIQWLGFSIVLVATTVLMTSRSVAEVFRKRTGDLVRPLPWPIAIPMFSGLMLTVIGCAVSMTGFSYVGPTTYAVIPTAFLAAILFGLVARDTRHAGLVWASLIALTIAYQCSPTLFSDLVATLRAATADAINRERVPLSMYGITYLPLLGVLAIASRFFAMRGRLEFSEPLKHYVTVVATLLFGIALSDIVSAWFVAGANIVAFTGYAIAFRDRRYMMPAIAALVLACGLAIPALNEMEYANIARAWIPTVLAGLAAMMTVFGAPDRIISRLPRPTFGRSQDFSAPGQDRYFQWAGCAIAGFTSIHWLAASGLSLGQPLSQPLMLQFSFLLAALVLFTLRNPHYLSALTIWTLVALATLRWAVGLDISLAALANSVTGVLTACSVVSGAANKWLRRSVFSVSLFDLSSVSLSVLITAFHLPALVCQHVAIFTPLPQWVPAMSWTTTVAIVWLAGYSMMRRSRVGLVAASALLPLVVTGSMLLAHVSLTPSWVLVVWATTQSMVLAITKRTQNSELAVSWVKPTHDAAYILLVGSLAISCFSFDLPLRLVAIIAVASLLGGLARDWNPERRCGLAILANIHLLLAVASWCGCSGWVFGGFAGASFTQAIPSLFCAVCGSVLVFDRTSSWIACEPSRMWAGVLRIGAVVLAIVSLTLAITDPIAIATMIAGFALLVCAEVMQAISRSSEARVWSALAVAGFATWFLFEQNVISLGLGISQFVLLALSTIALSIAHFSVRFQKIAVTRRPMLVTGLGLPSVVAGLAVMRELAGFSTSNATIGAMAMMLAAGIYFHQSIVLGRKNFSIPAIAIANLGLAFLWRSLGWNAPELFMVPIGISILGLVELLKNELPRAAHDPLRYIAALTILCSPMFEILGGDWVHILALMLLSVAVILLAIGLRLRSLVYAGSAFLLVDLVAMVVRSTIHNLNLLWICGVVLGAGVIALAAFCENHRDKLLSRIRIVSAELARWN